MLAHPWTRESGINQLSCIRFLSKVLFDLETQFLLDDPMPTHKRPPRSILRRRQNLVADVEALLAGLLVIVLGYFSSIHYAGNFRLLDLLSLIGLLAAMTVSYDALGVYRRSAGLSRKIFNLLQAWALSFAIVVLVAFAMGVLNYYTRIHIGVFFVAGFVGQLVLHVGLEIFQRRRLRFTPKKASLIVGEGWLADYLSDRINANPWVTEKVVGSVPLHSEGNNSAEDHALRLPVLGTIEDIDTILDAHDIKTVYILTALDASLIMRQLYFKLLDRSINIHWVPNIFALSLINLNVKELAGVPIITLSESPMSGRALFAKSIADKMIAILVLLLVSPILILAAIAITIDSQGPVFFFQERTGWDGKVFPIWKFRTMYAHTPKGGIIQQAARDDPRVTRVGRFLRRTSIDELPQLFNVLGGSMSLVGPRPHAVQHNDLYSRKIDAYLARHRIKPGITGLAQVRGFRGETKDLRLMEERVRSDIEYINNWSLLLDLSILIRTALIIFDSRAY